VKRAFLIALVGSLTWQDAQAGPANDLEDLRGRIHKLQQDLSTTEGSRNEAADALRKSERAISEANRNLRNLDQQQQALQAELAGLRQRSSHTRDEIDRGQAALAQLLRQQYEQGAPDSLTLLLSGKDPDDMARQLEYLRLIAQSRAESVKALRSDLQTLAQITAEREQKARQLAAVQAEQASQRKRLQAESAAHAKVVASLSSKMKKQKRSLESLQRDEKRLTRLVEDIARMLAKREQERRERLQKEAERKAQTPPAAPGVAPAPAPGKPPAVAMIDKTPEEGYDGDGFVHLKGHLRLPLAGELTNRFGSPRSDSGLSWKGLFIRAPEGRDVKAVASGRVVFADWLRGFGNLLIIDHGGSYMSLYGGAQTLFAQVGDIVNAGVPVATAGSTGGNSESGIYFELRYQSRPFDPMTWVGRP
jgi:septal ring factor EnvC (AmiA/AmiB activator)